MSEANSDNTGQQSFMSTIPKFDFSDPRTLHDRVLLVEDKKFYVQSGLLMVWSEYFKVLFGENFNEANMEEIELKDVSAEDFNNFLQIIHPTEFEVNENNYAGLISLAHRFLAPRVFQISQMFLNEYFEELDKFTMLTLAFQNDMVELKDKLADFIGSTENKNEFTGNLWIYDNIDRISQLPSEIQAFVHRSSA